MPLLLLTTQSPFAAAPPQSATHSPVLDKQQEQPRISPSFSQRIRFRIYTWHRILNHVPKLTSTLWAPIPGNADVLEYHRFLSLIFILPSPLPLPNLS